MHAATFLNHSTPIVRYSFLFLLVGMLGLGESFSQCRDDVRPSKKKGDIYYQARGDAAEYCEGFIRKQVNNKDLILVQYTVGDLSYNLATDKILEVKDGATTGKTVQVRVEGKRSKFPYRLDGSLNQNNPLNWDLAEVVKKENITPDDIGIYGYLESSPQYRNNKVYVPLEVGKGGVSNAREKKRKIVLRPGAHLEEIRWKLKYQGKIIISTQVLTPKRGSFFAKNEAVTITIPASFTKRNGEKIDIGPGIYDLEVSFRRKGEEEFEPIKRFVIYI